VIKLFWRLARIALPLLILALPVAIVYGHAYPWATAETILKHYDYSSKITVGVASSYQYAGGKEETSRERTYILLPKKPVGLKMVTISQRNQEITKDEWPAIAIYLLAAFYSSMIYLTYKIWEKHLTRRCS